MKILLLTDRTINKTMLGQVQLQVANNYKDLNMEFVVEDFDFTTYPIEQYWGGYWGIQQSWLRARCADIYKKYAESIDCVVFLVASPNWKLDDIAIVGAGKGVWGWNHSNQFSSYGVQQVRFAQNPRHTDERNVNNSAGTLYHELMHDHDTYVFVNTGEVVERTLNVASFDEDVVHGRHADWAYIRTVNDNVRALQLIMQKLIAARDARKRVWLTKKVGLLQQIVRLMVQLRALQAGVRGDIPCLPDNKCVCCTK
jgi:hypothetical protein